MKKIQWTINAAISNGPTMQGSGNLEFELYADFSDDLSEKKKTTKLPVAARPDGATVMLLGIFADKYDQEQGGQKSKLIVKPDKFGHLSAPVLLLGDAAAKALEGVAEIEFTLEVTPPPDPALPAAGAAPAPSTAKPPEVTRNVQVVIGTELR